MGRSATLRDVAGSAGVSIGTVSRVLNGRADVAAQLRERVWREADRLGYELPRRPVHDVAHTRRIRDVGFLLVSNHQQGNTDLMTPFWAAILAGAEKEARAHGARLSYRTVPAGTQDTPAHHQIADLAFDAILLVGSASAATIDSLLCLGLPLGLVDMASPHPALDAVISDSFGGARTAVDYLISAGHRQIGFVGGPLQPCQEVSQVDSIQLRLLGYETAMRAAGLPVDTSYIGSCDLQPDSAAAAARSLLDERPDVTALFCPNDTCAAAIMRSLHDTGREIPANISVIGFDDDIAVHTRPALTTMRVDKAAMGRLAIRRLFARAEHPDEIGTSVTLPVTLVERASVAPPRPD